MDNASMIDWEYAVKQNFQHLSTFMFLHEPNLSSYILRQLLHGLSSEGPEGVLSSLYFL